jgi:hypothetical protein
VAKKCRDIIDDVEKLDAIRDGFIHFQLIRFCQATRLQHINSHIMLGNRCVLLQQHVDCKVADALLKKGTKQHADGWDASSKDWAILLTSSKQRAQAAIDDNNKAMAAAHNCVAAILELTSDSQTHELWRKAYPVDQFKWTEKLVKEIKDQQKLRDADMIKKSNAFSLSLSKINRQEHELEQLMTKVLEFEATYHAAEAVYKTLEADFNIDQTEENRNALHRPLQKSKDAQREYTQAGIAENEKINECTTTYKQDIADGDALLPLTSDGAHFQNVWKNLQLLKVTNYTLKRDTIRDKRAKAAEHQRKLDERNKLIAEAAPLTVNLNIISKKNNDGLTKLVQSYETLTKTRKLTTSNIDEFTLQRKKFDDLLEQLRLCLGAYNQAAQIWLSVANRIVRCIEPDKNDDVRKIWLNKVEQIRLKDFDRLLKDRKIDVSSILAIPSEALMAPPQQLLIPKQPEGAPQNPIVSPQQLPPAKILQPPSEPASLDKVVLRPSDAPHNSHQPQEDQSKNWDDIEEYRPIYNYKDPSHFKASSPPPCSFKQSMLAFATRRLPLVYPPTRAPAWLARPAVARYAHPDRARTAGGNLELHALCARIAHIALLVHLDDKLEPLAVTASSSRSPRTRACS